MLTNQVFVSHTSDLTLFPVGRSFVQAALDGIGRAGMAAVDMRYFPAGQRPSVDYCRQRVRECEVYVAIVGFRYGSIVPDADYSYTEAEFREATAAGKPRLVFLLDEGGPFPEGTADQDLSAIERFRRELSEGELTVARFTTADGLEMEVSHALAEMAKTRSPAMAELGIRHSLPLDATAFTGRSAELEAIASAATRAMPGGGVVVIGGMPGTGKTALAVHVAHRLRARFPDRQLFVDLHAHTPGQAPVQPADMLASLLGAVGVDPRYLPAGIEGRIGLWRDRMAGQRALLLLDNAASSEQVTPLLPGGVGCLVLVTSRRYLGDLPGAVVGVPLDSLPPDEARVMFLQLAPRAAAQSPEVGELVHLAGYLPLAISLLARVYAKHPAWTLADLMAETKASRLTLAAEKDSVTAAFDVSYRYLAPDRQRFFRCLGLSPRTVIDAYAAAALAGVGLDEAAGHLDGLHSEGLLAEVGYRRYGMHDLLRSYARELAAALNDDSRPAVERLLDFYQHTAALADVRVRHRTWHSPAPVASPPVAVPDLTDGSRAARWLRHERVNLLACLDRATESGEPARVVAFTAALATLLRQEGPWAESIARYETALAIARESGDQPGQAYILNQMGAMRQLTGDFAASQVALNEALDIYTDRGDRLGRANTLLELGVVGRSTGKYRETVHALETALNIYVSLGDQLGQANSLLELGACRLRLEGNDYRSAAESLQQALKLYRGLDDQAGQANALHFLGYVWQLTGDYPRAVDVEEEALALYSDLGNRLGQGNALNFLGNIWSQTDDHAGAIRALEEALAIYRELGYRVGQANALKNLATAYRATNDYPEATRALDTALRVYRDIGDRGGEAEALNESGALRLALRDPREARAYHEQALGLSRELRSSRDEAHALAGLGRTALADGDNDEARSRLLQAHEIFQRISAAEIPQVAAELEALSPGHSV